MNDFAARLPAILDSLPPRISHIVRPWAVRSPERPALIEGDRQWSYGELPGVIAATRQRLGDLGVRPGDRAMIVGENGLAAALLILAAADMDAWPVMVNARLSPREIDEIRDHCGARRVFYCTSSAEAAAHAARHGAAVAELGPVTDVAAGALNDVCTPEPVHADGAEQVAVLLYTSGTTGQAKGVMLSHRSLLYIAAISAGMRRVSPEDRVYGVLPIAHVFGLASVFLGALYNGATLYLVPRFDPAAVIAALDSGLISVLQGVPAMYARLLAHLKSQGLAAVGHSALRLLSSGGAALDPALKEAIERAFGLPLYNGYGLTECAPTISQTRMEPPRKDTSVGPLLPGVAARLVDDRGRDVAPSEVGELCVRTPGLMKGYYRAPEATATTIDAEGWFHTGDLARFEGDHLFIVGRCKELIIRSGFNVYPAEVEAVLNAHPDVAQSAVVGRRVPGNEEVVGFVQLVPGRRLAPGDLISFAAERLAPYKRPAEIIVVDTLPASSTGKILKHRLAERAAKTSLAG
jgi:acyl-CoA synthetase (AMP-forming)/AMP-acid ligase II